ncbi:MAG TPA: nitroreductase family deazaflavin-dependent oxidoreductase [Polyangiaceae bacterium]|jgi:deazaflavin-dependent oxidoreductase (nitroreductase family)
MATPLVERGRPRGVLRWALRSPIVLYRARMGWLLGGRFLMLTHTGRTSGAKRRTVVEVVDHDAATDTYFIASGWGEKSDWLQNVTRTPRVTVDVGARRFQADAVRLPVDEAVGVLGAYARHHPRAFAQLGKLMIGERLTAAPEECRRLAERAPLVALRPIAPS